MEVCGWHKWDTYYTIQIYYNLCDFLKKYSEGFISKRFGLYDHEFLTYSVFTDSYTKTVHFNGEFNTKLDVENIGYDIELTLIHILWTFFNP